MSILQHTHYMAEYNCSTYGAGAYGTCAAEGGLAETGFDILLPIFLGVSLVAASLILITRRLLRKRRQQHETT